MEANLLEEGVVVSDLEQVDQARHEPGALQNPGLVGGDGLIGSLAAGLRHRLFALFGSVHAAQSRRRGLEEKDEEER